MAICTKCGAVRNGDASCNRCGASQPALVPAAVQPSSRRTARNPLVFAGLAAVVMLGLGIEAVHVVNGAKHNAREVTKTPEPTPGREAVDAVLAAAAPGRAADQNDAGSESFPAWQSSSTPANPAPPRKGMLVVTAIADPEGDYESMKQIREVNAKGVTLSYHAAKTKDGSPDVADLTRLVLTQDLDKAHNYAQLFSRNQPLSVPGTTAISVSKEVLAELSQKGSSEFSFQPEGMKGAIGNMVNVLTAFGGLQGKDVGADAELDKISKDTCTLKREGTGLVAFPVLLDDQPTTLPALTASCSTDDGPAKFYILNQPDYPLLLAWKLGSGSQLQVTKISYPPAPAKAAVAPASTHIEQQLEQNKRAEVYGIYFDFGSDRLKPESTPVLEEIAAVLAAHPDWKLDVNGHTDNLGGGDYNLDLSTRRSAAVKAFLTKTYHIASSRLEANGFGASRPVDTNTTIAGRARNRRVELVRE